MTGARSPGLLPSLVVQAPFSQVAEGARDNACLVDAACAGNAAAFREIYRRFARVVHGIALARVGPAQADDLTQDVFMIVHRRLPRLRDAAALPGWIARVARNHATDFLRKEQRNPKLEPLEDRHCAPQRHDGSELRERVLALIRGMPDAYSETLVLRLVEGLTGPEIAERTGMTPGSVRVNLCRGMAMLRSLLEKEGWR